MEATVCSILNVDRHSAGPTYAESRPRLDPDPEHRILYDLFRVFEAFTRYLRLKNASPNNSVHTPASGSPTPRPYVTVGKCTKYSTMTPLFRVVVKRFIYIGPTDNVFFCIYMYQLYSHRLLPYIPVGSIDWHDWQGDDDDENQNLSHFCHYVTMLVFHVENIK